MERRRSFRERWRTATIRFWGAVLFGLTLSEGALGVLSATQTRADSSVLVVSHVVFGAGITALAGWVLIANRRLPIRPALLATAFTVGALLCNSVTGALFLLIEFPQGAVVDRVLATISLGGAILMMVCGSDRAPLVR